MCEVNGATALMCHEAVVTLAGVERRAREEPFGAPVNSYRAGDDRWSMLTGVDPGRDWPRLLPVVDKPEWAEDRRFATMEARRVHARS